MENPLYPIGTRVEVLKEVHWYTCFIPKGSEGSVVGYGFTGNPLIQFDEHINGHSGVLGEGLNGHCWWIWPSNILILNG